MKGELFSKQTAVLISVRPQWCEKIANREKTLEIRKNKPKIPTPFTCYIYCTLPPRTEMFGHGIIREYANELIRTQGGKIIYGYGMQLVCDNRPYTEDNFLCRKVIGEFVCDNIKTYLWDDFVGAEDLDGTIRENAVAGEGTYWIRESEYLAMCLSLYNEILPYGNGKTLYGWHISALKIYDKPKGLSEFGISHVPQSWQYVHKLISKDEGGINRETNRRG